MLGTAAEPRAVASGVLALAVDHPVGATGTDFAAAVVEMSCGLIDGGAPLPGSPLLPDARFQQALGSGRIETTALADPAKFATPVLDRMVAGFKDSGAAADAFDMHHDDDMVAQSRLLTVALRLAVWVFLGVAAGRGLLRWRELEWSASGDATSRVDDVAAPLIFSSVRPRRPTRDDRRGVSWEVGRVEGGERIAHERGWADTQSGARFLAEIAAAHLAGNMSEARDPLTGRFLRPGRRTLDLMGVLSVLVVIVPNHSWAGSPHVARDGTLRTVTASVLSAWEVALPDPEAIANRVPATHPAFAAHLQDVGWAVTATAADYLAGCDDASGDQPMPVRHPAGVAAVGDATYLPRDWADVARFLSWWRSLASAPITTSHKLESRRR